MLPLFSFVVIAYNVERYIGRCLQSIKAQTVQDFEVIVVNDASKDGTLSIIQQEVKGDSRFRVVNKSQNEGAHLARRAGALSSTGRYVIFVDGDDAVTRNCLELLQPVLTNNSYDFLRFGRNVIPLGTSESDIAFSYANEEMFNQGDCVLSGLEILLSIFSQRNHRYTWSIIDCAFNGEFVRQGFQEMTDYPLGRMQDSYEMFVLCSKAQIVRMIPDIRGLKYYLGAGVSGRSKESVDKFNYLQQSARQDIEYVASYARTCDDSTTNDCASWLKQEYLRIIGNEWVTRLSPDVQTEAVIRLMLTWPAEDVYSIVLGPIMARGQWLLTQDSIPVDDDEFYRWGRLLDDRVLPKMDSSAALAYRELCSKVDSHVVALKQKREERQREEARQKELLEAQKRAERSALARCADTVIPEGSLPRDVIRLVRMHLHNKGK
ncbi:glycosyltransferase family 2 protein [Bifidobacterium sp. UTCIF-24]|uniref:glycosyltransferase family 2 protein n=1 Tax=Bifidobacterium sp. UTCIF-24 TaxID=1465256 RepID=UPI00112C2D0C|nr:glycosyltransferase family 2 protein [Bifidobacterium sp. UTCIF-24]TPF79298.1 hypothetical protein BW08_10885 [Bifidobacterium sp. UTCIF-24]